MKVNKVKSIKVFQRAIVNEYDCLLGSLCNYRIKVSIYQKNNLKYNLVKNIREILHEIREYLMEVHFYL